MVVDGSCGIQEAEIKKIDDSDSNNSGITRKLIRIIKKWEEKCGVKIKSYKIEDAVLKFLDDNVYTFSNTQALVYDFFCFLVNEIRWNTKKLC